MKKEYLLKSLGYPDNISDIIVKGIIIKIISVGNINTKIDIKPINKKWVHSIVIVVEASLKVLFKIKAYFRENKNGIKRHFQLVDELYKKGVVQHTEIQLVVIKKV